MLHQGMTRCGNPQSVHNLINTATLMPQLFDRNVWAGLKRIGEQSFLKGILKIGRDSQGLYSWLILIFARELVAAFIGPLGLDRGSLQLTLKSQVVTLEMLQAGLPGGEHGPAKVGTAVLHPGEGLVAVPRFGYVVAMLCSCIIYLVQHTKCYGYIPASMALVNDFMKSKRVLYFSCDLKKNRHKENDTRLSQMQTPTPVTDTHTTTSVTNAQIQAMINEGVTADWQSCLQPKMVMITYTLGTGARMAQCMLPPVNVKGTDVVTYSQRFQELALMCDRMFQEEIDKDAIEFVTKLMDKKINTWAERQATTKESLMTPPGTTRISNLSKTETKTLEELYCHWKW
ncbi:hypothetical protein Tco_1105607 [Tanacetum coccineum]